MIEFNYETDFKLDNQAHLTTWIETVVVSENHNVGDINYVFCDDSYLHKLNVEFLKHDTFTDIITFDYSVGKRLHSDIFISIERVFENAKDNNVKAINELYRVMVHGILHLCGYKDKEETDRSEMRKMEDHYLELLLDD